jgi:hypothetical protein
VGPPTFRYDGTLKEVKALQEELHRIKVGPAHSYRAVQDTTSVLAPRAHPIPTSAPGLGSPHPHVCAGTGLVWGAYLMHGTMTRRATASAARSAGLSAVLARFSLAAACGASGIPTSCGVRC